MRSNPHYLKWWEEDGYYLSNIILHKIAPIAVPRAYPGILRTGAWNSWGVYDNCPPSDPAAFRILNENFDPLTFDWSVVHLGPKTRAALEAKIEELKALKT